MLLVDIDILRYDVLNASTKIAANCAVWNLLNPWKLGALIEIVEGKYSLCHRGDVARCDLDLDILNLPNFGLIFTALDTLNRSDHTQKIGLFLVFSNWLISGIMMLLIAEQYVIEQRTFGGKETNCYFQWLGMPIFTFQFSLPFYRWREILFSWLQNEPHLSAHAEIGNT